MPFETGNETFVSPAGKTVHKPKDRPVSWRPSVYALYLINRMVLVVKPELEGFILPGGGIEPRESIHDALVRECLEELGQAPDDISTNPIHVGENAFYCDWIDEYAHALIMVYEARFALLHPSRPLPALPEGSEIVEIRWMSLNQFAKSCNPIFIPMLANRPFVNLL